MIEIVTAVPADAAAAARVEAACFPPAEACSAEEFARRIQTFPESFFFAKENGVIIGMINGCVTDKPALPDELYHDSRLHRPDGDYQTVFGLDVLPEYRRKGVAAALLHHLIRRAEEAGRKGVILTCKDPLRPYYEKFGFVWQGVSASTHGGAVWNDMLLLFDR